MNGRKTKPDDIAAHREVAALAALELARLARKAADIYEKIAAVARTKLHEEGSYELEDLRTIAGANTQMAEALSNLLPLPTIPYTDPDADV